MNCFVIAGREELSVMPKFKFEQLSRNSPLAGLAVSVAVLLGLATRGLAMPADAQRPDNPESVKVGRQVAEQYCARCHAIGSTGKSPNRRAPRFPLIAERFPGNNPAGILIDGTVVRHPGMPEFQMLESETDGLVAYIRRISRKWHRRSASL
jgi:mono/diheme cytochrome c family protein